ncbi:MAG: endonuclease domain-containing protein [Clostridia bacterium]|nr:endonuclease domain-containing protein [Clostridia bacterium]
MDRQYNKDLVQNAKDLRKNMTKEERRLWYDYLRACPARFTRQKVLGKYIADFYSAEAKMIIELDGSQHYEEKGVSYDKERSAYLEKYGLKIIRLPNNEINNNFYGVCEFLDGEIRRSLSRLR